MAGGIMMVKKQFKKKTIYLFIYFKLREARIGAV